MTALRDFAAAFVSVAAVGFLLILLFLGFIELADLVSP